MLAGTLSRAIGLATDPTYCTACHNSAQQGFCCNNHMSGIACSRGRQRPCVLEANRLLPGSRDQHRVWSLLTLQYQTEQCARCWIVDCSIGAMSPAPDGPADSSQGSRIARSCGEGYPVGAMEFCSLSTMSTPHIGSTSQSKSSWIPNEASFDGKAVEIRYWIVEIRYWIDWYGRKDVGSKARLRNGYHRFRVWI